MIEVGLIGLLLIGLIGKYVESGPAGLTPVFVKIDEEK